MLKFVFAAAVAVGIAATSVAQAQQPAAPARPAAWSAADVDAFSDARIASLKAGLKLNADQEKNWPPLEASIRDMAKQRIARMTQMRAAAGAGDPVAVLRTRADAMTESAASLRKLADASEPLYKSLDDAQKRRLVALLVGGRRR
jgi:hypothetical protein